MLQIQPASPRRTAMDRRQMASAFTARFDG
jgi:hypothetical protein